MGRHASWIEVGPRGAESCLVIYPKSMMEDWAERKPSIVFACEDVQKTYEVMHERGVQYTQEPKDMPWGPFAIFVDQEGNWFGLRGHSIGQRSCLHCRGGPMAATEGLRWHSPQAPASQFSRPSYSQPWGWLVLRVPER
jgi:lactoylglutathione lyase